MKNIIIISAIIFAGISGFAQGIKFEKYSLDKAIEKAKKENKHVFIDCYTTWCGPCKKLAKNVFPLKKVGDFFNSNFINLKVNMEVKEGWKIQKKYSVSSYPTLLFINGKGEVSKKITGFKNASELIETAHQVSDPNWANNMDTRYDKGERDFKFLASYVRVLDSNKKRDRLIEVGDNFMKNTPKKKWINMDAFTVIGYSKALKYNSKEFKYIVKNKDKFIKKVNKSNYEGIVGQSINRYLKNIADKSTMEELQKAIKETKKVYTSASQSDLESGLHDRWYLANKQYDKWFKKHSNIAKQIHKVDKSFASRYIIVNIANAIINKEGVSNKMYKDIIDLVLLVKESNKESHVSYYFLAMLNKKMGNKEDALKHINTCIDKQKKSGKNDIRVTNLKKDILTM